MTKYLNPITRSNGADQIVVPERVSTVQGDDAVETGAIQDGAVTEEKIADGVLWSFEGEWVATTTYENNNVVRRNSALYISTSDFNTGNDPGGPPPMGEQLVGYMASSGATGITGSGGIYAQPFIPTANIVVYGVTIKFNSIPGASSMQVHIGTGWPSGWTPLVSKTISLSGVLAGQSVDVVFPTVANLVAGTEYKIMLQGAGNVDAAQVVPYTSLDIAGATNGVGNKGGDLYQFTTPNSTYRLLFSLRAAGTPFWQLLQAGAEGAAGGDLSGTYPNPTIATGAVTSAKIADGTIATGDLADSAVTSVKIADGTISLADLSATGMRDATRFLRGDNTWSSGPTGPPGLAGSKWWVGSGAPTAGLGVPNDMYLDNTTGNYYVKYDATTWNLYGNLTGPTGPPGTPGSVWYAAPGVPSGSTPAAAIVGDFYLNTSTGDVYQKTSASAWALRTNILGPPGQTGNPGTIWWTGAGAPTNGLPPTAMPGDLYLNTITSDVSKMAGDRTWSTIANLKGIQGNTGPAGSQWLTGSGAPTSGLGVVGDMYLNTTTADYYKKTGGLTWALQGNMNAVSARGVLPGGYVEITSNSTTNATGTIMASPADVAGLAVTVTTDGTRLVRLVFDGMLFSTVAADQGQCGLREGSTLLTYTQVQLPTVNRGFFSHVEAILTPSAGSHTYKVSIGRVTGTGNVNVVGSTQSRAFIMAEDIGPA